MNIACMLCYIGGFITGIIFLVLEPYNKNKTVRFHAFQSIFTFVALFVIWVVWGIISMMLPWWLTMPVGLLLSLFPLLLWVYLIVKAYQNEKVVLPVVGELAEKQA